MPNAVETVELKLLPLPHFLEFWRCEVGPVDFCFNADPLALKLITHNKIVFRAGRGSCLPRLQCKRNARCVTVTDLFVLIKVSTMKARCSPVQFMSATEKETKSNGIIKKRNKKQWHYKETKQNSTYYMYFSKMKILFCFFILFGFC